MKSRDASILEARAGGATLSAIANTHGISPERVRQVINAERRNAGMNHQSNAGAALIMSKTALFAVKHFLYKRGTQRFQDDITLGEIQDCAPAILGGKQYGLGKATMTKIIMFLSINKDANRNMIVYGGKPK